MPLLTNEALAVLGGSGNLSSPSPPLELRTSRAVKGGILRDKLVECSPASRDALLIGAMLCSTRSVALANRALATRDPDGTTAAAQ